MRIGVPRWLGALLLLGVTVGCVAPADEVPPVRGAVAVVSYHPPDDAPAFCRLLADSVHVHRLPVAIGTLTADPGNRAAAGQVADALAELESVLAEVPAEERYAELTAGLEDLLAAVHSATEKPLDDGLRARISTRLDGFGAEVQPVCVFPA